MKDGLEASSQLVGRCEDDDDDGGGDHHKCPMMIPDEGGTPRPGGWTGVPWREERGATRCAASAVRRFPARGARSARTAAFTSTW